MSRTDPRPPVAVGHVFVRVADVKPATAFFLAVGVRPIVTKEDFAVLELRGGTHIVVRPAEEPVKVGERIGFDFIVDDIDEAHSEMTDKGLVVAPIERGRIHDGFEVTMPDGQILKINSTHAGGRPI